MGLLPESLGNCEWIDIEHLPPCLFVTRLMELPVVSAAERDRKLVAHLQTDCFGLCKPDVMWIGWPPFADQARLRRDEFQVRFITKPLRWTDRELALVSTL